MNEVFVISGYLVIFAFSEHLYRSKKISQEAARKITHILSGSFTIFLPYLIPFDSISVIGIAFAILLFLMRGGVMLGSVCRSSRRTYGSWLMPLGIALTAYFFGNDRMIFQFAVGVVAFADSFAAIFGNSFSSRVIPFFDSRRTIFGTSAFFLIAFLISVLGFISLHASHYVVYALLGAVILALVEFVSIRGTDNITVMLVSAYLFSFLS
jgi:dolichol kinase